MIPEDWSLDRHFREKHGQEIFDELTEKHKGQRVNYVYVNRDKDIDININGTVFELYAPADKEVKRTKDNYRVLWDNGKVGVIELEDKAVTLLD